MERIVGVVFDRRAAELVAVGSFLEIEFAVAGIVLVGLHAVPLRLMLGALVVGVLPAQALLVQLILQGAVAQTFITFPVVGRAALRTDDNVVVRGKRFAAHRAFQTGIIHSVSSLSGPFWPAVH